MRRACLVFLFVSAHLALAQENTLLRSFAFVGCYELHTPTSDSASAKRKKVTSCQDDSNSRPAPQSSTRSSLGIWIPRCAGICQCCRLGTSIVTVPFTLSGAQVTWDTTFSWAGLAQSLAGRLATSPIQIRFLPALER